MKKNIVIVTHKFVTHPDDELVFFLNKKKYSNVLHICHSFYEALDRKSYYKWYKNGDIYQERSTRDYKKWPEPLIYLKEFLFTLDSILSSKVKWDKYIGMDGLCVFFGNMLKITGHIQKTIFWAIDFVPENRFKGRLKNKIYHFINKQGYKRSDEMWDLSPRMADARKKYLGIKKKDYELRKVVPYGMWINKIKKIPYKDCEKSTVVFMGRIIEGQGAQLIIKAIPEIIKKLPNFKYKIIGTGPYKDNLISLAGKLRVEKYCNFMGRIEDHRKLEEEIAKSALAVAPYIKKLDTWTYYADPGKVKTYLACGVPVLLTDLPWNAKAIEKENCGKIIREDQNEIINKILFLMDGKRNQNYRDNAVRFAKSFDYQDMFSKLNL